MRKSMAIPGVRIALWEYTEHEKGKIDQNDLGDMPIHGAVKFRNVIKRAFG